MSKHKWSAVETLLTFWPPAPCARIGDYSISFGSISIIVKDHQCFGHRMTGGETHVRANDATSDGCKSGEGRDGHEDRKESQARIIVSTCVSSRRRDA